MKIVNLTNKQLEDIESRLEDYDKEYTKNDLEGAIRIGIKDDNGNIIAGLDAVVTTFKILYVSTLFVDEKYRRQGIGTQLIKEMELRAKKLGVNTIRLDTLIGKVKTSTKLQAMNQQATIATQKTDTLNTSS